MRTSVLEFMAAILWRPILGVKSDPFIWSELETATERHRPTSMSSERERPAERVGARC